MCVFRPAFMSLTTARNATHVEHCTKIHFMTKLQNIISVFFFSLEKSNILSKLNKEFRIVAGNYFTEYNNFFFQQNFYFIL